MTTPSAPIDPAVHEGVVESLRALIGLARYRGANLHRYVAAVEQAEAALAAADEAAKRAA